MSDRALVLPLRCLNNILVACRANENRKLSQVHFLSHNNQTPRIAWGSVRSATMSMQGSSPGFFTAILRA